MSGPQLPVSSRIIQFKQKFGVFCLSFLFTIFTKSEVIFSRVSIWFALRCKARQKTVNGQTAKMRVREKKAKKKAKWGKGGKKIQTPRCSSINLYLMGKWWIFLKKVICITQRNRPSYFSRRILFYVCNSTDAKMKGTKETCSKRWFVHCLFQGSVRLLFDKVFFYCQSVQMGPRSDFCKSEKKRGKRKDGGKGGDSEWKLGGFYCKLDGNSTFLSVLNQVQIVFRGKKKQMHFLHFPIFIFCNFCVFPFVSHFRGGA